MLTDFYGPFSSISFTILGLWFVVAQTRYADWMASAEHRRRASAVSLHFALPGLMSLLSLSDPDNQALWRLTFAAAGTLGAVGLAVVNRGPSLHRSGPVVRLIHWVSIGLYLSIAGVALLAESFRAPLRVEAVLLSLLVFFGVCLAWLLMFEPGDDANGMTPSPSPRAVVVSGHMVDAPDREGPRFRADQVGRVTDEVRRAFERWGVGPGTTVVCGGARGADIIAAEQGLARGAHVRLCLALPPDEFEEKSVAIPGTDWSDRFRALLAKADVSMLADRVDPVPEGDDVFARTNEWMVEEATHLAGGRPHALTVWNGGGGDGPGGTADLVRRLGFERPDPSIVVIDPTFRSYESRQAYGDDDRPKRLLALDGGGIRGVLSLEILARIEKGLRDQQGNDGLVLSEWFDYIGGTSTGAIIAAGLASGLSVEQLLEKYQTLGEKSFSRSFVPTRALYQAEPLTEKLDEVFGKVGTLGHPDLRTLLLVVLHNTKTDSAWPLSNCTQAKYNRADRYLLPKPDRNLDLSLIDLLRGSTAAPVFFPPQRIVVGQDEFLFQDGGITPFNNPALLLFLMATLPEYGLEWPVGEDKLLVVSVGTGTTPAVHENLVARQVGLVFNAKNLTSVFMNGASVGQDLLCRTLGRCRFGEPLDREIGDRLNVTGIAGTNLFTYVRYNAALTDEYLGRLGFDEERQRKRIRRLDGVKAITELRCIGCEVGAHVDVEAHFEGFL